MFQVVDLQKALKERGLTITGLKADLVDRLHGALGMFAYQFQFNEHNK